MTKRILNPIVLGIFINSIWVTMRNNVKRNIMRTLFAPALVLLSSGVWSFASAATYHVRIDGNDTSCNGSANVSASATPNCAFRTVQKGINAAQAGDTVSVHAGDYSAAAISSVRPGTASAPITISGAGDGLATLGKTKILSGHNYITMRGLNFSGFPSGPAGGGTGQIELIDIKGEHFTYTNNHMQPTNAGSYGYARGIRTHSKYTTISNSTFEAGTVAGGPSFYNVITVDSGGDYFMFDHNIIKNMVDVERVFELWASNPTFSNNEMFNFKSTAPAWCHPDIWQMWGGIVINNLLAENNYFHDMQSQIGNLWPDASIAHSNSPWVFRNNVFANVTAPFFIHLAKLHFYNNTFYNVKGGPHPIYAAYAGGDSIDVKNNIFVGSGDSTLNNNGWYAYISGTGDYNYASQLNYSPKNYFSEAHAVNGGNPMFVNAQTNCVTNKCDFHIQSGSVLIGKGTPIAGFSTDKDGRPRTGAWDIGAYAYGSSGSVIAIQAPKNLRAL